MFFFAKHYLLGACPTEELTQLALPVRTFLIDVSYACLNTLLYIPITSVIYFIRKGGFNASSLLTFHLSAS